MLERLGHDVTLVEDGQQAVDWARDHSFDIVILDVHMPHLDGRAATRILRSREASACVPIIALTASVMPEDIAQCKEAGMDVVLGKPLSLKVLRRTLQKLSCPKQGALS